MRRSQYQDFSRRSFAACLTAVAVGLLLFGGTGASAREIMFQEYGGEWRVMDESAVVDMEKAQFKDSSRKYTQVFKTQAAFNVTFVEVDNNTGFGFDDPAEGQARRETLLNVLAYFDSILDHNGEVDVTVRESDNNPNITNLAFAGTSWFTEPSRFDNGFAFQHMTTGTKPAPGAPDLRITVNFGKPWHAGDGNPPSGQFDLFSVMVHEVCHGLGFLSLVNTNSSGTVVEGGLGRTNPDVYTVFDRFLSRNGALLLSDAGGATFLGSILDLTGDDLVFAGPNAREMFETMQGGSGNPPLHSPSPYDFSSASHWDQQIVGGGAMTPAITAGTALRELTPTDKGALMDIGYRFKEETVPVRDWRRY